MFLSNLINSLGFCSLCLHANAQLPCTNVKQVSQESTEHSNHYDSNNDDHPLRFYLRRHHHHHHHHHQGTYRNVLFISVIAYIHIAGGIYILRECVRATRSLHDEVPRIWFTSWPLFFLIFLQLLLTLLFLLLYFYPTY